MLFTQKKCLAAPAIVELVWTGQQVFRASAHYARPQAIEEARMPDRAIEKRPVCSIPLCGAPADWATQAFGKSEYYCDRHKPLVPLALLKKIST